MNCICVNGKIICPGCDGYKKSEFGLCSGCNGIGIVVCGKCVEKKPKQEIKNLNKVGMKKQTAVEWFEYNLKDNLGKIVIKQNWQLLEDLIKQAKEMEKSQIMKTWYDCKLSIIERNPTDAEQYYNETFKSE
jgi:hypothetical protein